MWPFNKSCKIYTCSEKHLFIFLAGVLVYHTLTLIAFLATSTPPINYFGIQQSQIQIAIAIVMGFIVTGYFFWQVSQKKCTE